MFKTGMAEMREFDPRPLSRPELIDALDAYDRLISLAEANRLLILGAIDDLGDRGADGEQVGRSRSRRSARRAKQDAKTASALKEMPGVAQKLADGEITTEHAASCAAAAARTSTDEADELAEMAASMPADLFATNARKWATKREDRKQRDAAHRRQRRKRSMSTWSTDDGMVHFHAKLDSITGHDGLTALRERIDTLWRADGGRDGNPDDERSPDQRAADAFAALMTQPAAESDGPHHPRSMVHLIHHLASGQTTLLDGTHVPDEVLLELGPAAEVVGHVFDGEGRPLWLGRSTRLASRDQWIALIARDQGCDECAASVDRCEAHHPQEWDDDDGPTDIDNLQLLCHTCHGHAHRGSRGDPERWPRRTEAA
jgi:hypothetical protein